MAKYLNGDGLSHLMTTIKNAIAATVTGVKGDAESSYRTGQVNLTPANIGAIKVTEVGNTQQLRKPSYLRGVSDPTIQSLVNTVRANRLAFLPADQIIIEKTTDGGVTWVDAGVGNDIKTGLFSETRAVVNIPRLDGVRSMLCGIRVTFTAMKYNVPSGTAETEKYAYWSSEYVIAAERYNQIKEMYLWVNAITDTIGVKLERANGSAPNKWYTTFDNPSFLMTGWSGCDYFRFDQQVFGGATSQTGQAWNYRLTFMTKGTTGSNGATLSTSSTTSNQSIMEIRAYGDTYWTAGSSYAARDHLYRWDYLQNATFPGSIFPNANDTKDIGSSSYKWANVYATTFHGNVTGSVGVYDTRNTALTPSAIGKAARFYFANSTNNDMPYSAWWSLLHVNGWDGSGYSAWELAGPANNSDQRTVPLYVRTSNGSTAWGSWRKIFDDAQTIPIANGGTGATTAAAAWTALGGGAIGKKASLAASDIPSHASSATTYGTGSSSNYGHVKLSDSTSASTDTTGGTAATPKAVKAAYDLANGANTTAGQALSAATGALAFKVTYSVSGTDVVCAAHVYSGGSEVTSDHADSCFVWSMSLDGGSSWTSLGTGKTKTVSAMSTYGGNVKCDFTPAS